MAADPPAAEGERPMTPDPIQGAAPKIGRAEGLCGNTSRPLHYIAAMVLGLGFTAILVLLAFTHMSNLNETAFEATAEEIKALINQRLTRSVEIVHGLATLFHASAFVESYEFRIMTDELLKRAPNIDAAVYTPLETNRRLFEDEMEVRYERSVRITELRGGELVPAQNRSLYAPVQLLQPMERKNQGLLGFDFLSDPKLRKGIDRAIGTGESAMAGLVVGPDGRKRYWLFRAIYRGRDTPLDVEERRNNVTGLVAVRINPALLFDSDMLTADLSVTLMDDDASVPEGERTLYRKTAEPEQRLPLASANILTRVYRIYLGERTLVLQVTKRLSLLEIKPEITLIAFSVGLLITVLLLLLARYTILRAQDLEQRHEEVSRQVTQKTLELSTSEERYRQLVETTNVVLFEAEPQNLRFTYVGPQAAKLLGYAVEDWYQRDFWTEHIHAADRERTLAHCRKAIELGEDRAFECRMLADDGRTVWVRILVTIPPYDEEAQYLHGAMLDITEVKEAALAMTIAKEEAEIASRAKSSFLANVSHELRTPLNAVIGFSEMIRNETFGPTGDSRYREYAKDIHDSGRHLLSLINDILDVSKIEAGKFTLHEEPVALPKVVTSALRFVRERARMGRLTLSADLPYDLPMVLADERSMKQVLLNLLTNAVKFTPEGGTVTVRADCSPDGEVRLAVADTGIGMAKEDLPRAMESFGQIDSDLSRRYEGTGLGLPLAKRLIEMHDGRFEIESEPDKGTVVTVILPADRRIDSEAAEAPAGPPLRRRESPAA